MEQQFTIFPQPARRQVIIGFTVGLIFGIIPGIILYLGGAVFPGTGGPGVPADPNYDLESLLGGIFFLVGSLYYLLAVGLSFLMLFSKNARKWRPICYGTVIMLTLSLLFARVFYGFLVWYMVIVLSIIPIVVAIEKIWQWQKHR